MLPARIARRYAVLPLRLEHGILLLASEEYLDPVAHAALRRKLGRPVSYVVVPKGQVTIGLRYWYGDRRGDDPRQLLRTAVLKGEVDGSQSQALWSEYVPKQVLFGEVLMSLGHLDAAALNAVLLKHERTDVSLGQFLVDERIIDAATLNEAFGGTSGAAGHHELVSR
jgi:adsorption protein B